MKNIKLILISLLFGSLGAAPLLSDVLITDPDGVCQMEPNGEICLYYQQYSVYPVSYNRIEFFRVHGRGRNYDAGRGRHEEGRKTSVSHEQNRPHGHK